MKSNFKSKLKAQYLCGIITEAQYHEVLMSGGPKQFDTSGKGLGGPKSNQGNHDIGDVHAQIHGSNLILSATSQHIYIELTPHQIEDALSQLGIMPKGYN
jgi:hypothetical protein